MQKFYLTETEQYIFKEMITGATNIEIARKFIISPHTAKAHVSNIINKMHAKNRVDAVAKGLFMIFDNSKNIDNIISDVIKRTFSKF